MFDFSRFFPGGAPSLPLSLPQLERLLELAWYDGLRTGLVAGGVTALVVGCMLGYLLGRDRGEAR